MAFSGENINLTKQRVIRQPLSAKVGFFLRALFRNFNDNYGNPQLQYVAFSALTDSDVVICGGACTLYAIYYKKPAASSTTAVLKIMNHATAVTQATPDYAIPLLAADEGLLTWPQGQAFSTGITIQSNTSSTGGTGTSAADKPNGWFLIGA